MALTGAEGAAEFPVPADGSKHLGWWLPKGLIIVLALYRKARKNIVEDGLIVRSSRFLVKEMIHRIDFSRDLHMLEVGSGKGVFTRQLAERMTPDSRLDVCEVNVSYNPWIQDIIASFNDKRIALYNQCITEYWQTPRQYDVILSSLPLKNFAGRKDNKAFLQQVVSGFERNLKPGGRFLQYQYFRSNHKDIEEAFGKKMNETSFVLLNVLPAFVYSMTK